MYSQKPEIFSKTRKKNCKSIFTFYAGVTLRKIFETYHAFIPHYI